MLIASSRWLGGVYGSVVRHPQGVLPPRRPGVRRRPATIAGPALARGLRYSGARSLPASPGIGAPGFHQSPAGHTVGKPPTSVGDQLHNPEGTVTMLDIGQRRPLVSPSSGVVEGLFSDTLQPAHQLTPSELPRAGCPVSPKPRNERAYKAACVAAEGEKVREYDAREVEAGMRAWCTERFLAVAKVRHMHLSDFEELHAQFTSAKLAHPFVLLQLEGDGATTAWIIGELDTPVYCLA